MNTLNRKAARRTWPLNVPVKIIGGGGGRPPGPSPSYGTALWMKILASVMNTLSKTICNILTPLSETTSTRSFLYENAPVAPPRPARERKSCLY